MRNASVDGPDEALKLAEMLGIGDGVLFVGAINSGPFYNVDEPGQLTVYVNCNDLFMWGCADCQQVNYQDIDELYSYYKRDEVHGVSAWAAKRRGVRPQDPVVERMKRAGAWTPELEALPRSQP